MKRIFIFITILVLTLTAAIALGVDHSQTVLAQAPQPPAPAGQGGSGDTMLPQEVNNLPEGASTDGGEIQDYPYRQMSYQGRLEVNGSPANGNLDLTFRLYNVEIGSTAIWTETQTVHCDNGLFSVMLGAVTPLPLAVEYQFQLWLGIQPEGAAVELSPRQILGTVGYAMNLMPGATMVDTNPYGDYGYSLWVYSYEHHGIYASSDMEAGIGVSGYASGADDGVNYPAGVYGNADFGYGVHGEGNYGVVGSGYYGVAGYTVNNNGVAVSGNAKTYTGAIGVQGLAYGTDSIAVYAFSYGFDSPAIFASTVSDDDSCSLGDSICTAGVAANSHGDSYGMFSYATQRSGLFVESEASSFYATYIANLNGTAQGGLAVSGYTFVDGDLNVTGSKSGYVVDVAFNASSEPLEQGDVVVVTGMDEPIMGNIPLMRVEKATPETVSSIVGVVDVLWESCEKSVEELQAGEICGRFNHEATTIQPGQYLSVVTLGAFQWLKVDATSAPIHAGDLLSISATPGVAAKAQQITIDGYSFYAPGTIIGKALQDLDSGTGVMAVFVSLK